MMIMSEYKVKRGTKKQIRIQMVATLSAYKGRYVEGQRSPERL